VPGEDVRVRREGSYENQRVWVMIRRPAHSWCRTCIGPVSVANNTISQTEWVIKRRGLFWLLVLQVQGGKPTSGDCFLLAESWVGAGHQIQSHRSWSCGDRDQRTHPYPPHTDTRSLSLAMWCSTPPEIHHGGFILTTLSNPDHLPKAPPWLSTLLISYNEH
jgi:hypothetical protein